MHLCLEASKSSEEMLNQETHDREAMEKERSAEHGCGLEGGVAPHCELATKGRALEGLVAEDARGKLVGEEFDETKLLS